jgi:hypothetical protein
MTAVLLGIELRWFETQYQHIYFFYFWICFILTNTQLTLWHWNFLLNLNINPSSVEGFTLYHEGIWWDEDVASHVLNLGKWM